MKNETAANRLEDNYYYKRGFDEGYKAGYQKALENVPEILATQSKSVIVIPKENEEELEELRESLQTLAPGKVIRQATAGKKTPPEWQKCSLNAAAKALFKQEYVLAIMPDGTRKLFKYEEGTCIPVIKNNHIPIVLFDLPEGTKFYRRNEAKEEK